MLTDSTNPIPSNYTSLHSSKSHSFKMKFSIIPTIITVALPLSSAWSLKLYNKESYKDEIHSRSGTLGQACKNLGSNSNKAESMHWDHGGFPKLNCKIKLYNSGDCSGSPLGDSNYADWNLPAFSSGNKNKLSSYDIDCK